MTIVKSLGMEPLKLTIPKPGASDLEGSHRCPKAKATAGYFFFCFSSFLFF